MKFILRRLRSMFAGVEWQLVLLKVAAVLTIAVVIYLVGRSNGKDACHKEYTKQLQEQIEEIKDFVPVTNEQTKRATDQAARVEKKKEVYDAEVDKNSRSANCDLSDSELRAFQDLVEG